MDNIYRGEPISKNDFIDRMSEVKAKIEEDLLLPQLMPEIVIEAAHTLAREIDEKEIVQQLVAQGIQRWAAEEYVSVTVKSMDKKELYKKLRVELGEEPFAWKEVGDGVEEKNHPLGVLLHIGAGNALGLSAFSVIEGLMTGNINILKLPENEGGISSRVLLRLAEIEPKLKPYIYVLDVSSKEHEIISELFEMVNAVVVWGSDDAIRAIRQLAPPYLPVIEWGHRLSFGYFTNHENEDKDLEGLARDICITDQLYCSSPQCVFYEIDNPREINEFAERLSRHIQSVGMEYPASPLFRNVWVMPIKRKELLGILRRHKGHLQTVGLSCSKEELDELSQIFYAAGITRIADCGNMSVSYSGEPHDGVFALKRYIKRVNRRRHY